VTRVNLSFVFRSINTRRRITGIVITPLPKDGADERGLREVKDGRHFMPKSEAARIKAKKNVQRRRQFPILEIIIGRIEEPPDL